MCGILGGYFQNPSNNIKRKFEHELSKLSHRGPDDRGCETFALSDKTEVILGHTRLSIIDLSEAGHQPMSTEDGSISIVFNGEIYNYIELREEITNHEYQFNTRTDTEVLLKAYHLWGAGCLKKLTGMFALCIYDKSKQTLIIARDAFGIKPLFYTQTKEGFLFSSELNPILGLVESKPKPNYQVAFEYIVHGNYDDSENTFFKNIKHLRPASYIEFDLTNAVLSEPTTWWSPKTKENNAVSFEEASRRVKELFVDSVKIHLRSDVPVGVTLSGGIDSSAVVCTMRHLDPNIPIHTFSYIAAGSEKTEEKWVDFVNDNTNSVGHKVSATPEELMRDLGNLIYSQGEPFGTTSIYAQYRVFKLANQQDITVTLDGQGADELLAGYDGYPGERLVSLFELGHYMKAFLFAKNWSTWPGRKRGYSWLYLGRKILPSSLYKISRRILGRNFEPKWLNMTKLKTLGIEVDENRPFMSNKYKGRRVVEQLSESIKNRGLPSLLRHGDRNSMKFSIESRVPFLTTSLVDYLFTLPENYLISDSGETKSVFKHAMRGIVPKTILERKDKIGFDVDSTTWKHTYIEELKKINIDSLANFINIEKFVYEASSANESLCWRVLNYVKWYELFIDND